MTDPDHLFVKTKDWERRRRRKEMPSEWCKQKCKHMFNIISGPAHMHKATLQCLIKCNHIWIAIYIFKGIPSWSILQEGKIWSKKVMLKWDQYTGIMIYSSKMIILFCGKN